jgi:hypothetical protein
MKRLLFLDFDGVLHPDAVYLTLAGVELRAEGELFMWAPLLVEALSNVSTVSIVLSTSWVRNLGFYAARRALPAALQPRVIGATWHSAMGRGWPDRIAWDVQTRYQQVAAYLGRTTAISDWIALDDDAAGWPKDQLHHLVRTNPDIGLSDELVQAQLARWINQSAGL